MSLLDNLLRMEAERAANSQIERQRITAPVFIIGLPRTGTTHLHGLISEDPAQSHAADVGSHVSRGGALRCGRRASARADGRAARLGRSPGARVHAHPSDRGRPAAGVHRDHGAGVHEHPVPHDARRRVVSGLVRRARRRSSASTFTIASCSTCKRRAPAIVGFSKRRAICSRSRVARALPRRAHHPHASRSAARHGVDGESCDGAAARVQRQRGSETHRRGLGGSLGARARHVSRRARSRARRAVPRRQLRVDRERSARHRRARLRFSRLAAQRRTRARR